MCLSLLNFGCSPGIPQADHPTSTLPSAEQLIKMVPLGVAISPTTSIKADSRGWQYWQMEVHTTEDAVWWPVRITANTLFAPLAIYISSFLASDAENNLQKATKVMALLEKLQSAIIKEIHGRLGSGAAFLTDNRGQCVLEQSHAQPDSCPSSIRNILVLEEVKVFLDKVTMYKKTSEHADFNLIILSRWALQSLSNDFTPIEFEEVTSRSFVGERSMLPNELRLIVDEHSKEVVNRLQQPSPQY
jgi:hypothetical protein